MIRAEHIIDPALANQTLARPEIWDAMSDDGHQKTAPFKQNLTNDALCLGLYDDDEYLGMFLFYAHNSVMCEVHICMLPSCGGIRAVKSIEIAKNWIWRNTNFLRIIGQIPSCNVLGLKFARIAGLELFGVNPRAWLKNGELHDILLLGVSYG